MQVSPYLMFNGNCAEALKHYEQALGATTLFSQTYKNSPAAEHAPADFGDKIMHVSFKVGDTVIMASDAPPGSYKEPAGISVALGLNDTAKGEQIFNALSDGGQVMMPYQPTFWAAGFGMCVDRFGIPWMINVEEAGAHGGGSES